MSAVLFGAGTPFAKLLLGDVGPWLLAGLLYTGSGLGLLAWRLVRRAPRVRLQRREIAPLVGAVFFGGLIAPVLLMAGLANMPASGASLLLNAEAVFTAVLAWFVFHENFDRRIALGMLALVAGAVVLSWSSAPTWAGVLGPLAIAGACVAWGLDNNLTRKVSLADPLQIVELKGLIAGPVSLAIGFSAGGSLPPLSTALLAGLVGFIGYGVSLALFVRALRDLGTARTGTYFSTAPFVGAVAALIVLGEPVTLQLGAAGLLMAIGVWLHLTEVHEHEHEHEPMEHEHRHVHDAHHQHAHSPDDPPGEPHTHRHRHERMRHKHPHVPDMHHTHRH